MQIRLRVLWYKILSFRYFEFWPMWLFYPPVVIAYIFFGIRYRSLRLPLLSNPGIPNSGIIGEKKSQLLRLLSQDMQSTLHFKLLDCTDPNCKESAVVEALQWMKENNLSFPIILKPDIGQRGSGVQLVRNVNELHYYCRSTNVSVLVQEYCNWPNEVGINYVRYPFEEHGRIVGVTRKRFPNLIGDGHNTIANLILADPRARYMASVYFERHHDLLNHVLAPGKVFQLVQSGNHCQGAIFENGCDLVSDKLTQSIDKIAQSIPNFFVGRFDLRFETEAGLKNGEYRLIELNGAAGEATHIYDSHMTLKAAYGILFRQLLTLFQIGAENKQSGFPLESNLVRDLLMYRKLKSSHPATS